MDILSDFESSPTAISVAGYIIEFGRTKLSSKGICYGLTQYPTVDVNFVEATSPLESPLFNCDLTGLISDTIYYVRAYARDEADEVYYSAELSVRTEYKIGSPGPAGGIVYYLDNMGGGMEVATGDQAINATWGCQGISINAAQNVGIGYGYLNTTAIVANCSDLSSAGIICDQLILNGYDDWYLPSLDELSLIYLNVYKEGKGNFTSSSLYWSSTEQNVDRSWLYFLGTNSKLDALKGSTANVRAVRSF